MYFKSKKRIFTIFFVSLISLVTLLYADDSHKCLVKDSITKSMNIYFEIKNNISKDAIDNLSKLSMAMNENLDKALNAKKEEACCSMCVSDKRKEELKEAKKALTALSNAKTIEDAKDKFATLSFALKGITSNLDQKYFLYYCPMEKKYWVQDNDKEVLNPYLKSMKSCGEKKMIEETKQEEHHEHMHGH